MPGGEDILCVRATVTPRWTRWCWTFPFWRDYAVLEAGGRLIYATHGHVYNAQNPPPLHRGDILLHGHTHIPVCEEHDGFLCLNPGSTTIPKAGSSHGYMTLEHGHFRWMTLEGTCWREYDIWNGKKGDSGRCLPFFIQRYSGMRSPTRR